MMGREIVPNSEHTAANLVTCSYFQRANFICKIGRKGVLSQAEKSKIVQRLHNKISTLEIAKELHRDHHTFKILYYPSTLQRTF